jgi:hypothetical protein
MSGFAFGRAYKHKSRFETLNFNNMENVNLKNENPADANNVLAAGLSRHQLIIYGLCKHYGAEIQVHINFDKGCTEYTLVEEGGETETIRKDTFDNLKKVGAIKLKWKPAVFVERWG